MIYLPCHFLTNDEDILQSGVELMPSGVLPLEKRIHAQFVFYLDVQPLDANMIIIILIIKIHVNKKMDTHVAAALLHFLFEMVCFS